MRAAAGPARRHRSALWAGVVLSLSLAVTGCSASSTAHTDASMPTSGSGASSAADAAAGTAGLVTSAPLETPTTSQTLPVYWLGHSNDSVFLYREFVAAPSTDDPIVAALRAMMTERPNDSDYFSVWNKPSRLGASVSAKNVITVDVSSDAFGQKVDQGIAERSVAQLVYTATAAAAMAGLIDSSTTIQVSVLVDGHTGYNAFGHVPLTKPLTRDSSFVAPVWIIDPADASTYSTLPLRVSGQGISATGVLGWSLAVVENGKPGKVYLSGTVAVPQGPNVLGTFSFNLVPPLGTYELSVFIPDPANPGTRLGVDTKVVTLGERGAAPSPG
ncbi:hypothetical protein AL755_12215 [Arthrobacter sp. ERGS1:01]|nr:hypothetical protein AL755_12215 [Arthrobacter sp. ERGS1:01]